MFESNANLPCAIILTALPVEHKAVRFHLQNIVEKVHEGTFYELGLFQTDAQSWSVVISETGMSNSVAAAAAERDIAQFKPRVALFVGVAGGLKDVQIGDVVAANKVYGYEFGKVDIDGFKTRPFVYNSTHTLEQQARAVARSQDWLQRLPPPVPNPMPKVLVGAIAAGEEVLASTHSQSWNLIKQSYGDALAVEMEGHGFLTALHTNQLVGSLIVRGISDLIDGKQQADAANSQNLAAQHASAFAFEVLAKLIEDKGFSTRSDSEQVKPQDQSTQQTGKFVFNIKGDIHNQQIGDHQQVTINYENHPPKK
jgi:nucleoside phosphorylase